MSSINCKRRLKQRHASGLHIARHPGRRQWAPKKPIQLGVAAQNTSREIYPQDKTPHPKKPAPRIILLPQPTLGIIRCYVLPQLTLSFSYLWF